MYICSFAGHSIYIIKSEIIILKTLTYGELSVTGLVISPENPPPLPSPVERERYGNGDETI